MSVEWKLALWLRWTSGANIRRNGQMWVLPGKPHTKFTRKTHTAYFLGIYSWTTEVSSQQKTTENPNAKHFEKQCVYLSSLHTNAHTVTGTDTKVAGTNEIEQNNCDAEEVHDVKDGSSVKASGRKSVSSFVKFSHFHLNWIHKQRKLSQNTSLTHATSRNLSEEWKKSRFFRCKWPFPL